MLFLTSIDNKIHQVENLLCCPTIFWYSKLNTDELHLEIRNKHAILEQCIIIHIVHMIVATLKREKTY